jgi:beta-N-acetylhexosaminidase
MRYLVITMMILGLLHGEIAQAYQTKQPSLRDKIGQMLIIGFDGKQVNQQSPVVLAIEHDNIGGVILFDVNNKEKAVAKNIENPRQVRGLNTYLQQVNHQANQTDLRPDLPLIISLDYEGGRVTRLKDTAGFPATLSAADVGQLPPLEAEQAAEAMAKTVQDNGFNLDFAPVVDVNVNPDNPIIGSKDRSFSSEPTIVADDAALYSHAFLKHGVQCAYKHFPGHGSSMDDSHLGFVDVSDTWTNKELRPYSSLLGGEQPCGMVMTAHIVNQQLDDSGLPATLSYKTLTGVLRNQLLFDGVIITDDMQMKAISEHYGLEQALTLAINAGADMFIFANQLSENLQDPKELIDIIEANVKSGKISQHRIDDAYRHIVTFKQTINS